jgi:tRNA(fMet)-specific endonuclease VapC
MVVDVLRGRHGVGARLAQESPEDVAIASMTLAELLYGARCAPDPAKSELAVHRFVEVVRVLPFGRAAARLHAVVRHALRHKTIGPNDLMIAATSLAAGATMITGNLSEFERVPGLAVENWR